MSAQPQTTPAVAPPPPSLTVVLNRPLVAIEIAMFALDLSHDELVAAVEEGEILYAFNLCSRRAKTRFVRIWNRSLAEFATGKRPALVTDAQVINEIVPPGSNPQSHALSKAFCADPNHIDQLGKDKLITAIEPGRPGPGGQTVYDRASVARFLLERRML